MGASLWSWRWAWLPCGTWDLSSPNGDGAQVPCIGKQSLNPWTTGKPRLSCVRGGIFVSPDSYGEALTPEWPFGVGG